MGLLDQVIGGVLGSGSQGGSGGGTSPLVKALMLLLAAKAANTYIHQGGSGGGSAPSAPAPQPSSGTIQSGMMAGMPSLDSILDRFRSSGHGDKVESWLGTGPNKPVSPGELEQTLGSETVDQLQNQTGMSKGDLMGQLSQYLPQIIDKLSPNGQLPAPTQRSHW